MKRLALSLAALGALVLPNVARADELRDFCADRPGLGTPACIVDKGHVMAELGIADWTRDSSGGVESDTLSGAQMLLRAGVTSHVELQLGWDGFSRQRQRDAAGNVDEMRGGGDALVGLKIGLLHPDGSGTSVAVLPYAKLPAGKAGIGAGDWSAGVIVPMSFALRPGLALGLTPGLSEAVNGAGGGRHLAWGGVAGLGVQLSKRLSATGELGWQRDDDPAGHTAAATAGLSLAWLAAAGLQIDGGVNLHLGGAASDRELYLGVSRRF